MPNSNSSLSRKSSYSEFQIGSKVNLSPVLSEYKKNPSIAFVYASDEMAERFRTAFYNMPDHFGEVQFLDLGVHNKISYDEFQQLHGDIRENGVIPLYIGFNEIFISAMVKEQESKANYHECCIFSPDLDLYSKISDLAHLEMTKYTPVAFQGHLIPINELETLPPEFRHSTRLGIVKNNPHRSEPFIRQAQTHIFDLSTIKSSELQGLKKQFPTGLATEEACQLAKYIGLSEKAETIFYSGSDQIKENSGVALLATITWYFIDGLAKRDVELLSEENPNLTSYAVQIESSDDTLRFFKSKKTGKWWVQHIDEPGNFLACTYEDYLDCCNTDIPPRILAHCFQSV